MKKRFTISLDEDLIKKLKIIALNNNIWVNQLVKEGAEYIIKKYEENAKEGDNK